MILRMPSYYKKFHCTADKCSDNCCIGWEIDIDKKSLGFYKSIGGDFGKKLDDNISAVELPHFILNKDERCPFLNENNLCEIYINLGEDSLCEICTNHPRFFEWYDGIKEGGIGLCCEAAAKIIITSDEPFSYYDTEIPFEDCHEYDNDFFNYLFKIREKIICHINDKSIPLKNRLNNILYFAAECQNRYDNFCFEIPDITYTEISPKNPNFQEIIKEFLTLEQLDEQRLFEKLIDLKYPLKKLPENIINATENIAVYFIWRHFLKSVYEGEFYSKVAFTVLSCVVISLTFTAAEMDFTESAVYYSKEIEYSEQNLEQIFDNFYEKFEFSIDKISSLLKIF